MIRLLVRRPNEQGAPAEAGTPVSALAGGCCAFSTDEEGTNLRVESSGWFRKPDAPP
jgi:hypothetical protein